MSVGGGPTNNASAGLVTNTFAGGLTETITGALTKTINGLSTFNFNGIANLVGAIINLGAGPTYKAVLNSDMIAAFNAHTHTDSMAGATSPPVTTITSGGTPPYNADDMVSTNVNVS